MNRSIVLSVCERHNVSPAAFFGRTKSKPLVEARRAAVAALVDAGFSCNACARLIKRHRSTVYYLIKPEIRAKRRLRMDEYLKEYRATKKQEKAQREHLAYLQDTLRYCMEELRRLDPGLLAQVLS